MDTPRRCCGPCVLELPHPRTGAAAHPEQPDPLSWDVSWGGREPSPGSHGDSLGPALLELLSWAAARGQMAPTSQACWLIPLSVVLCARMCLVLHRQVSPSHPGPHSTLPFFGTASSPPHHQPPLHHCLGPPCPEQRVTPSLPDPQTVPLV